MAALIPATYDMNTGAGLRLVYTVTNAQVGGDLLGPLKFHTPHPEKVQ